jgi:ribosomal protein S18 acetylase RimI-like enzyme
LADDTTRPVARLLEMEPLVNRAVWFPRPYRPADRYGVSAELSPILDRLYPGGAKWLWQRLNDIEGGRARATVVGYGSRLAGVSIETPKEERRIKLSTLWVRPSCRRTGAGASLLEDCRRRWLKSDTPRADVTCASTVAPDLAPLLHAFGFSLQHVARDRYGEGRHELIYSWFPEAEPFSAKGAGLVAAQHSA